MTTRGMSGEQMLDIGGWIISVIEHVREERLPENKEERQVFLRDFKKRIWKDEILLGIAGEVRELCRKFPVPD